MNYTYEFDLWEREGTDQFNLFAENTFTELYTIYTMNYLFEPVYGSDCQKMGEVGQHSDEGTYKIIDDSQHSFPQHTIKMYFEQGK